MCVALADHTFEQVDRSGQLVTTKLFQKRPKIFFKNTETILSIKILLSCDNLSSCDRCSMTITERESFKEKYGRLPTCPANRSIQFHDSFCHINFSLSGMIDDLHQVSQIEGLPLEKSFAKSYRYLVKESGYNRHQFLECIKSKLCMPFEVSPLSFFSKLTCNYEYFLNH